MSTRMREACYRIGRSATGLGLFATAPIERGAFIVEYSGKRIATREARVRERSSGTRYMFEINRRWTVDGSPRSNIGRYANHSCRPNAESAIWKRKVILRAIKMIEPGEEITYDYGPEYFELFIRPNGCQCTKCAEAGAKRKARNRQAKATARPARPPARARRSRAGSNNTSAPSGRRRRRARSRRRQGSRASPRAGYRRSPSPTGRRRSRERRRATQAEFRS